MIYLLGGAGVRNFGDEMMLKNWLNFYRNSGVTNRVIVDGASHEFMENFFSDYLDSAEFHSVFSKIKWKGEESTFWESLRRGLNFYKKGGLNNYEEHRDFSKKLEKSSLLHLHGGGYLHARGAKNGFLLGVVAATKKQYGSKLVATGIGMLPLPDVPKNYRKDLEEAICAFDIFETRDRESSDYIKHQIGPCTNVFFGLDDTFLEPVSSNPGPKTLHFSWFQSQTSKLEQFLASLPSELFSSFERTLFWTCVETDRKCFEVVRHNFPKCEELSLRELVYDPLPLGSQDFMITSRFHPHFFAARVGARGVFSGGQEGSYYDVKQGSICQLGSSFQPFDRQVDVKLLQPSGRSFDPTVCFDEERVNMKRKLAGAIVRLIHS